MKKPCEKHKCTCVPNSWKNEKPEELKNWLRSYREVNSYMVRYYICPECDYWLLPAWDSPEMIKLRYEKGMVLSKSEIGKMSE